MQSFLCMVKAMCRVLSFTEIFTFCKGRCIILPEDKLGYSSSQEIIMREKVLATIKKYNMLQNGDGVVVGLSGGADSVSLIAVLKELQPEYSLRLYAVHLNHNIRGEEADRDEEFVRRLCRKLDVELFVFSRDVAASAKELSLTVEEAGRRIRYELFNKVLKETKSTRIAVAHNMNDNAETLLMRLSRGTGMKGLGGILPVRDNIIRPLIETSRQDIEAYCARKGLDYCTDSTNLSTDYTRNKIRLELLPWLRDNLNPSIYDALNKTAGFLSEEDSYLDSLGAEAYKVCSLGNKALSCQTLSEYDPVIRRRVLRLFFREYVPSLKDISADHISALMSIAEGKSGRSADLPYGLRARREYDRLILEKQVNNPTGFLYELELNKPVYIKELEAFAAICDKKTEIKENLLYTNCFKRDIINDKLYLRTYHGGDKIYLNGINGNKKLKKLFGEQGIAPSERCRIPLLAMDSEVLWVCGLKTNDRYKCEDGGLYFYFWRKDSK